MRLYTNGQALGGGPAGMPAGHGLCSGSESKPGVEVLRSLVRRVASVVLFCLVALLLTLGIQSVWTGLLSANLSLSPALPWSVVVMAVLLWAIWHYAGGAWWPSRTRAARRRYRRAELVPRAVFAWAMAAGLAALASLTGLWLVLGQLVTVPGNPSADFGNYSSVTVVSVVVMASLVGAVLEELGLRGYMLTRLESTVPGWLAVLIVAVAVSPGHGETQGFAVPTLVWYLAADLVFGFLALLSRSILPGMVVHFIGLLLFFSIIWPTDKYRHASSLGQQGAAFWIEALLCVALAVLSILAFRQLASVSRRSASPAPATATT